MPALTRDQIAQRAARELHDGMYVNLGIGMPTLVANFVPPRARRTSSCSPKTACLRDRPVPV